MDIDGLERGEFRKLVPTVYKWAAAVFAGRPAGDRGQRETANNKQATDRIDNRQFRFVFIAGELSGTSSQHQPLYAAACRQNGAYATAGESKRIDHVSAGTCHIRIDQRVAICPGDLLQPWI
jgi:hypothetical protein